MHNLPNDGLKDDVRQLKKAVFGNPENPKEMPGLISELTQVNATLTDIKDSMKKLNFVIILAVLTAVLNLVLKAPLK